MLNLRDLLRGAMHCVDEEGVMLWGEVDLWLVQVLVGLLEVLGLVVCWVLLE